MSVTRIPPDAAAVRDASDVRSAPYAHSRVLVSWARHLPILIVALGVVLRLRQYLSNRSQWLDEIMLSREIANRGYADLFGALGSKQAAPPGHLLAEHTFVALFGRDDRVLRLLPIVAGLASVIVFWRLTTQVLTRWAQPVALLLFATSPQLVYYSSEAKQYGVEQLATLVVVSATLWLCRRQVTLARSLLWGVVGALALWFAYPCVFVLTAAVAAVCLQVVWRRHWRELAYLGAGSALCFASFLITFHIQSEQVGGDKAVHGYWKVRGAFAPQPVQLKTTLSWLPSALRQTVASTLGSTAAPLVGVLLVVGLAALLAPRKGVLATSQRAVLAAMFVGLFVIAVGAAVFDLYPLGSRLAVYAMPLVFLVAAAAIDVSGPRRAYFGIIPALLLVLAFDRGIGAGMAQLVHPVTKEESKPVLAYVARHREPGDLILVYRGSEAAVGYYGRPLGISASATFYLVPGDQCDDRTQIAPLRQARRFWVVTTHAYSSAAFDPWVQHFGTAAHLIDSVGAPGAHAYLFASDPPDEADRQARRWPRQCPTLRILKA